MEGGFSYEAGRSPLDTVRLLVRDTRSDRPWFTDAEYELFLTENGGVVKLAAADAMMAIARDQALRYKVIRTLDLSIDGAKLAAELRASAAALREEVMNDQLGTAFDVVDVAPALPDWRVFP